MLFTTKDMVSRLFVSVNKKSKLASAPKNTEFIHPRNYLPLFPAELPCPSKTKPPDLKFFNLKSDGLFIRIANKS